MDLPRIYKDVVAYWEKQKASLSKDDIRHIADKDNGPGRMLGLFTISYWKREKLIKESNVVIGYAFKTFQFEGELRDMTYPSWVLFSPDKSVIEEPGFYEKVTTNLGKFIEESPRDKVGKKLKRLLSDNLAEVAYFELPRELTDGKLVYLSVNHVRRNNMPDFKLGHSLLLMAPTISKEVIYLPPKYWTKEWAELYKNGFKE